MHEEDYTPVIATLSNAGGIEKPSSLNNEVQMSQKLVAVLHDTISKAERELSKILTPSTPSTPVNEKEEVAISPTQSPLLMSLQSVNDGIKKAVDRIHVLLSRSNA